MATTKVSALTELTSPDGAEQLLVNDGGTSKRLLISNLPVGSLGANTVDSDQYVDGSIDTIHIADDQVTYAKIQNVSADERILGRVSGADGVIEELTKAQVLTFANVEDGADVTDATNVTAAGALMDSECAGLAAVKATTGTFLSADETKLDGIEASADVTDATNVTAAGALMDSEVTNLAEVKAFAASDYATAAQGTTADAALPKAGGAMTGAITTNSTFDGVDVAACNTTANAALPKAGGTMTGAVVGATDTDTSNSGTVDLDFTDDTNFVLTLTGNITSLTASNEVAGQSGFIVFIQDGTGSRTVSLHGDYETAAGAGLTLTSTASATDIVPYVVAASSRILLGTPQLAFA
jgi:hypothetical protein